MKTILYAAFPVFKEAA